MLLGLFFWSSYRYSPNKKALDLNYAEVASESGTSQTVNIISRCLMSNNASQPNIGSAQMVLNNQTYTASS